MKEKTKTKKWFKHILIVIGLLVFVIVFSESLEKRGCDSGSIFGLLLIIVFFAFMAYRFFKKAEALEEEIAELKINKIKQRINRK